MLNTRNAQTHTIFDSCLACYEYSNLKDVRICVIYMVTQANTTFVSLWLRHWNTWIPIQHVESLVPVDLPTTTWPLQDIRLLIVVCARIHHPVILPACLHCPHCCNTIARLLGNIWPPSTSFWICHTPCIIGNKISCKGQTTTPHHTRTAAQVVEWGATRRQRSTRGGVFGPCRPAYHHTTPSLSGVLFSVGVCVCVTCWSFYNTTPHAYSCTGSVNRPTSTVPRSYRHSER